MLVRPAGDVHVMDTVPTSDLYLVHNFDQMAWAWALFCTKSFLLNFKYMN